MTISIFYKGKEYIPAVRAGELVGYSADYVGQLCRSGKVQSKLINRTWYVELEGLEIHRKTRQLGKPRSYENIASVLEAPLSERISIQENEDKEKVISPQSSLALKYEKGEAELLPKLSLRDRSYSNHSNPRSYLGGFAVATLALIAFVVTTFSILELSAPGFAGSVEVRVEMISKYFIPERIESFLANGLYGLNENSWKVDSAENRLEIRLTKEEIRALLVGGPLQ